MDTFFNTCTVILSCFKYVSGFGAVGSVPGLGPGGRRFEPCNPDILKIKKYLIHSELDTFFLYFCEPKNK